MTLYTPLYTEYTKESASSNRVMASMWRIEPWERILNEQKLRPHPKRTNTRARMPTAWRMRFSPFSRSERSFRPFSSTWVWNACSVPSPQSSCKDQWVPVFSFKTAHQLDFYDGDWQDAEQSEQNELYEWLLYSSLPRSRVTKSVNDSIQMDTVNKRNVSARISSYYMAPY